MIDINKQCVETTGLIQRLVNITHLSFDWCHCGREVLFEKVCLFVVHKLVLHGKQFLAKQIRGIEYKMAKFSRIFVRRMI